MIKKLISAAILSSVIGSVSADPELGSMTMAAGESGLFNATIAIDATASEISNQKLTVKLGSITDFYRHGIDYNQQIASLRFKVVKNEQGKPVIRVSSDRKIVGNELKAVVKMTVGRKKIYGIYDIHLASDKSGHRVTFNLLNAPHNSQSPQLVQSMAKPIPEAKPAMDSQSAPSEDTAAALVKQRKKLKAVEQASLQSDPSLLATDQYRVSSGETISSIAMKLLPRYPQAKNWQAVMKRLVAKNSDVFVNGDINRLPAKAVLALPGQDDFASNAVSRDKPASQIREMATADTTGDQDSMPTLEPSAPVSTESDEQYIVSKGETISSIAKKLVPRYPGAEGWQAVMEQLVTLNPEVFINGDVNRLPAEATLALPGQNDFVSNVVSPDQPASQVNKMVTADTTDNQDKISAFEPSKPMTFEQAPEQSDRSAADQYQVSSGETISSIAIKLASRYPEAEGWQAVMERLVTMNSDVFINGDINRLPAEAMLDLPGQNDFASRASGSQDNASMSEPALQASRESREQYEVSTGETISSIAIKLSTTSLSGHSWRGIMKLLVTQNPDAFINENIDQISPGTLLALPNKTDFAQLHKVEYGESVSSIAMKLQQQDPQPGGWREIKGQLISMNPEAFINGNPRWLREDAFLLLPGAANKMVKAEMHELPQKQIQAKVTPAPEPALEAAPEPALEPAPEATPKPTVMAAVEPVQMAFKPAPEQNMAEQESDRGENTYRVTEGESLSVIALKLQPDYPQFDNWYLLMKALARLNPTLLADNDIGSIRGGTILQLPPKIDNQDQELDLNTGSIQPTNSTIATPYDKISKSLVARASSFTVPQDFTISMVAIKLFPDYPEFDSWPDLMDSIYRMNPDAFINNDINRLRADAELKLPDNNRS